MKRILVSLMLSTALTACVTDGMGQAGINTAQTAIAAFSYSDQQARQDGKKAIAELDAKAHIPPTNSEYVKRLDRLTGRHRHEEGMDLTFRVYNSPDVNAFAVASGDVRVYAGLMDLLTDDELLFVIGHEIGHIKLGHSKEKMRVALATQAAIEGLSAHEMTAKVARSQIGSLAAEIVNAQFSQTEETASDEYGVAFMKKHGYNVQASVNALDKLAAGSESNPRWTRFLSSHPDSKDRAAHVRDIIGAAAPALPQE